MKQGEITVPSIILSHPGEKSQNRKRHTPSRFFKWQLPKYDSLSHGKTHIAVK